MEKSVKIRTSTFILHQISQGAMIGKKIVENQSSNKRSKIKIRCIMDDSRI